MRRRTWSLATALVAAVGLAFAVQPDPPKRYDLPDGLSTIAAMRTLAGHHEHGQADNGSPESIDAIAAERQLEATCGYVSTWAKRVLDREGFESRVVSTLTLDEWDDDNNGHVLIEVKVDGRWVVFDIDRDIWFWQSGEPLSFIEYVEAVATGAYEIRPLSGDPTWPIDGIRENDKRVIQVPAVRDGDGKAWFFSADPERVESYSGTYRRLDEAAWRVRFYGVPAA